MHVDRRESDPWNVIVSKHIFYSQLKENLEGLDYWGVLKISQFQRYRPKQSDKETSSCMA